tara:strand:- start:1342 stop:2328 length:987 start_codon:yes stop_codon:yes gene_type:complete
MQIKKIKFSEIIDENKIYNIFDKNYALSITDFFQFELDWCFNAYNNFKDYDKFLILLYIIQRTLDSYKDFFLIKSYDQMYSSESFELEKFNVIDISRDLIISKETARRKILELQKEGILKRDGKRIVITKKGLSVHKPTKSLKSLSKLFSRFSKILKSNNILKKELQSNEIEIIIKNNFTQCWHYFYEFQIPYLLKWKKHFGELEKSITLACIIYNQNLFYIKNKREKIYNLSFTKKMDKYVDEVTNLKAQGVNAMTISDLSGIPRPTVLRKLESLLKSKYIQKDKKNLYTLLKKNDDFHFLELQGIQTAKSLSVLIAKFYNFINQNY